MAEQSNRPCGLPSVPRQSMPSMFQILSWQPQNKPQQSPPKETCTRDIQPETTAQAVVKEEKKQEPIIENTSLVKSEYSRDSPKKKRPAKSMTKSGLYEYKEVHLKRSQSVAQAQTVGTKVKKAKKVEKKLDPQNEDDLRQILDRQARIKRFTYVTRDLSNSAFTTYFGKPAWQAYGRGNSNPHHMTHNVMPHRGDNKPKQTQSYYSALLKGRTQSVSTYIPRKPVEQIQSEPQEEQTYNINLPLEHPDLINHPRFTANPVRKEKDVRIPSSKVAPIKMKNAKKTARKSKKKVPKEKTELNDGLKYMNMRQDLIKMLEKKKTDGSKLAWKVTECYPFDVEDTEQLKESTMQWSKVQPAGVESNKCDTVKQLLTRPPQSQ